MNESKCIYSWWSKHTESSLGDVKVDFIVPR